MREGRRKKRAWKEEGKFKSRNQKKVKREKKQIEGKSVIKYNQGIRKKKINNFEKIDDAIEINATR